MERIKLADLLTDLKTNLVCVNYQNRPSIEGPAETLVSKALGSDWVFNLHLVGKVLNIYVRND